MYSPVVNKMKTMQNNIGSPSLKCLLHNQDIVID